MLTSFQGIVEVHGVLGMQSFADKWIQGLLPQLRRRGVQANHLMAAEGFMCIDQVCLFGLSRLYCMYAVTHQLRLLAGHHIMPLLADA